MVAHAEGEGAKRRVVQDVMRGWERIGGQPPDLAAVVREIAVVCARYRVAEVVGDRYAGQWVRQAFREAGLGYREAEVDKARAYLEAEPLFAKHSQTFSDFICLNRFPSKLTYVPLSSCPQPFHLPAPA